MLQKFSEVERRLKLNELEINIVHHCNLSCKGCSHLSPISESYFENPEELFKNLSSSAQIIHTKTACLLGGEPLLHPRLGEIVDAIRKSGISDSIRIVTNGILIDQVDAKIWGKIDEIYVSTYPFMGKNNSFIDKIEKISVENKIKVRIAKYSHFREVYSERKCRNNALVKRVFSSCEVAHSWKCFTYFNKRIYLCPQSIFIRKLKKGIIDDGVDIGKSNIIEIEEYLSAKNPLSACKYCLGTVGKLFDHKIISRSAWRHNKGKTYEELIDIDYLKKIEAVGFPKRMRNRKILFLGEGNDIC